MNLVDDIRKVLDDNAPVSQEWLQQMMHDYPYYMVPLLQYVKQNPDATDRDDVLARLAIAHPDRKILAAQLGKGMEELAHFYPDEEQPVTPDTDTTIERFLENYGNSSQKEIEAIEKAIFNPMPDYADVLAAQERQQGIPDLNNAETEEDALINSFIAQSQEQERQVVESATQPEVNEQEKEEIAMAEVQNPVLTDDSMLSESLAKMYISRKKYSQALEIIENISLKFPEKSIYFADQIRFLRKLVLIQSKNNI